MLFLKKKKWIVLYLFLVVLLNYLLMYKKQYLLLFSLYLFSMPLVAQVSKKNNIPLLLQKNGFEIKINTKNLAHKKIFLFYTYGILKTKIPIDSLEIKENQEIVKFDQPKKIWSAIYQIQLGGKSKNLHLAVDNGCSIQLQLDHPDLDSLKCLNAGPNKTFLPYQQLTKPNSEHLKQLTNHISTEYPHSVLDLYLKLETKSFTKYKSQNTDLDALRKKYLEGINLTDDRLIFAPNLFRFMNNLVNSMPINNQNYKANIDFFLKNLSCKNKNYKLIIEWFLSNIRYNEDKMLEESFAHLFEKYIDRKDCELFKSDKISELKNQLQGIKTLPQGSTLPDYPFVNKDNRSESLIALLQESDYSLVVFFSPDCPHCVENVPKNDALLDHLSKKYPKINLKKISILNDLDASKWQDFLKKSNIESWTNLKDPTDKLGFQSIYNTFSNPNYLFLDKKGTVLLKFFNIKAVENFFLNTSLTK